MNTREIRHFINGEYMASRSGRTFANISPVDGRELGVVHEGGREEIDAAVAAARRALTGEWGKLDVAERARRLHAVARGIRERTDEFVRAECDDTGKPHGLASHLDVPRGAANFEIFADLVKNVATETFTMSTPDGRGAVNYSLRTPKGVVAVISPWNLPLLLTTWKVAPALACGNTVVVKPSEETPTTTALLGEVMNAAGIPPGVFNVVQGLGAGSAGEFLTQHAGIDAITFTGETGTGRAIMKAASHRLRALSFELGGKNPAIVFADADLDAAIEGTMRSCFANCGQVCLGTERIYVQRPIFERFVERLAAGAKTLKLGPPEDATTSMGPLISQAHRDKVKSYYDRAKALGATVVTGGGIPDMPAALAKGAWIEPTIWTGLSEGSAVVKEEIFGPCTHVAPFDTEDEALAMANDTEYGLAASIWTSDLATAHRVGARVEAGIVWINSWFLRDLRTPFGGTKSSGIGREGGVHSLEFYTELKNVCVKL